MKETNMPECLLPLDGVVNFRDMGGMKTLDGRRVKKGILFRAAELTGLTNVDIKQLEELDIKYVFDYRRKGEALSRPDPVIGNAINERVSVMLEDNITTHMFSKEREVEKEYYSNFTEERFLKIYREMPIRNPAYKRLMNLIKKAEVNLPLIHHCTGGRDRTGVGAMLILMTLGVPFERILDDYLLSNKTLEAFHEKIFDKTSKIFTKEEFLRFKKDFPLREEYLTAAHQSIIQLYGDYDTYLSEEFNITEDNRKDIQDYCLE